MVFDLLNLSFFSKEIIQFEVNRIPTSNSSVILKIAVMILFQVFLHNIKTSKDVLFKGLVLFFLNGFIFMPISEFGSVFKSVYAFSLLIPFYLQNRSIRLKTRSYIFL